MQWIGSDHAYTYLFNHGSQLEEKENKQKTKLVQFDVM